MAKRKVIWTEDAKHQRKMILHYWSARNRSKTFSKKLFREFQLASKSIVEQPFMGKSTDVEDVRYIIVRDYALTYYVDESTIHIISVWDERRDREKKPI